MFSFDRISFKSAEGSLYLPGTPVLVDAADFEGVKIAARNFANDIHRVTDRECLILEDIPFQAFQGKVLEEVVLIGSLQKSRFIRELVSQGLLDISFIDGKWETFMTIILDVPWAKRCFVIAGSDKRGTIFGTYALSERIGISPYVNLPKLPVHWYFTLTRLLLTPSFLSWHWWADVPVPKHEHIFALPTLFFSYEPTIKYRGLFINDEAPSLSSWVHEKIGPKFDSRFYKMVFELLLRIGANFIWPAMWSGSPYPGSSFFLDDPLSQELADTYGIVVSTSHHEPMQRSTTEWRVRGDGPWSWSANKTKIQKFFHEGVLRASPFDSYLTLGMRGEGDEPINAASPGETLRDVLACQRNIIKDVYGSETGEKQLVALYKEVLDYYDQGLLDIPDDVTIIFPDDNFGTLRRLPNKKQRARKGGCGIYFHLEYVGHPRGYKWLNTNTCGKIYQQLRSAYESEATTIWVFNVGDIKPLELPFTFAMHLAWDISQTSVETIPEFLDRFSALNIQSQHAHEAAVLLMKHDRLLALRKHEHIEANTYSIINYREADTIISSYTELENESARIFLKVQEAYKASFFQLIHHPIKASRIYVELRVRQAQNQLYGLQRRSSTNEVARHVLRLFDADFDLSQQFHNNPWTGDKWNHMMRQPHYGYSTDTWHDPSRDLITGLCYVNRRQDSNPINGQMGIAVEGHVGMRCGLINEETDRMQPSKNDLVEGLTLPALCKYGPASRWLEIFSRGSKTFSWTLKVDEPWIHASMYSGNVSPYDSTDQRVEISIDWANTPAGYNGVSVIHIQSSMGDYEQVHVPISHLTIPKDMHGFVEVDGYISIEAGNTQLTHDQVSFYEHQPYLGRTASGGISLRGDVLGMSSVPYLEYPIIVISDQKSLSLELYITMGFSTNTDIPFTYDIILDDAMHLDTPMHDQSTSQHDWSSAVTDCIQPPSPSTLACLANLLLPPTSDLIFSNIFFSSHTPVCTYTNTDQETIQLQLSPEIGIALKKDLTLRCVIKANYPPDKSRALALVISWAHSLAEQLSTVVLQKVGIEPDTGFSIQLNLVVIVHRVYFCYETFLDRCDKELRDKIQESYSVKRAIYQISERKDVYIMSRNIRMDSYVVQEYERLSAHDKGPLPLFYDSSNPPFYDNGVRREDLQHLYHRGPLTDEEKKEMIRRKLEDDAKKENIEN
ncbi:hypothetical protein N7540_005171 [Penicillium herquei]|nr:hypothetical protein N7540_005171 [Penicillium herquei]